jgi:hypothetical protein
VGYFGVKSAKVCRAQMGDQTCYAKVRPQAASHKKNARVVRRQNKHDFARMRA